MPWATAEDESWTCFTVKSEVTTEVKALKSECVLGLARTGLIFTGLQEGAQPGGGG